MRRAQDCLTAAIVALLIGCQAWGSGGPDRDRAGSADQAGPSPVTASTPVDSSTTPLADPAQTREASPTSSTVFTEEVGQEGAVVDWTAGTVTAKGIGYAPLDVLNNTQALLLAKRAAKSVAYRNLLEAFTAIRVDSTTTVKNHAVTSDEIRVKIEGMVKDATMTDERPLEKGGYQVTLQMKLTGRVSGTFAPKDACPPKRPCIPPPCDRPPKGAPYTGLVIDARGMEVRPALIPRILTEDRQEVYSQSSVLAKYRQTQGIAAYLSDPVRARTHPKVTNNPLFVKALRLAENSRTDLVISNAAAQTIHGVKAHFGFLEQAKVLVLIDPNR